MNRSLPAPVLALCAALLAPVGAAQAGTYEIEGRQVRVRLDPDWPAAMVGEPLYLSLTIENCGSQDIYYGDGFTRNALGRPDFVELETAREDGTVVPVPDAGPGFGGGYGPRVLRPGERQAQRLFLPHWAHITEPGVYSITCRRTYEFYAEGPRAGLAEPAARLPVELSTRIAVAPWDSTKVDAMIDRWSWAVRGPSTDAAHEAVRALCSITDPRVVLPLQSGIASGYYDIILPCTTALAKFEEDAALSGLKLAMRLDTTQLKGMPDTATAATLLTNLRAAAAGALGQSRHRDARAVLRTFEEDADFQVRLNVVHASGRHGEQADLELLRRRTKDANELVRGEAARYLEMLESR